MRVYLSSSFAPAEERLLVQLQGAGRLFDIEVTIGRRFWGSLQTLPQDVAQAIMDSEVAAFWLLEGGSNLSYVDMEAGFVRNVRPRLPLLIVADESIRPSGCLEWRDTVSLPRAEPWLFAQKVWQATARVEAALGSDRAGRLRGWLLAGIGLRTTPAAPVQSTPAHRS